VQEHLEEIDDDDLLYRRLPPFAISKETGVVISPAYDLRKNEEYISVDLARLTSEDEALGPKPEFGLGCIRAGDVRRLGFSVMHKPVKGDYAHASIEGTFTHSLRRKLAQATKILRYPVG
jgi:hypothetical protein